ncbi:MAG: hypothetical protein RBR71_10055 [Gudongella sp.]|nr:hypothetical protein [Gudongella sp.]
MKIIRTMMYVVALIVLILYIANRDFLMLYMFIGLTFLNVLYGIVYFKQNKKIGAIILLLLSLAIFAVSVFMVLQYKN